MTTRNINRIFSGAGTGVSDTLTPYTDTATCLALQVDIASTATVEFEHTVDGETWEPLPDIAGDTSATASGIYVFDVSARTGVRVTVSANGSGVTVTATLVKGAPAASGGGGGAGGDVNIDEVGGNAVSGSLPVADAAIAPADNAASVTPSDSVNLTTPSRSLFVGTAGDVSVEMASGTVVFTNVPNGTTLPIVVTRVNSTDTTASDIVALW